MNEAAVSRAARPAHERRRVSVLGATGSVGQSTLDLLRRNGDQFVVEALTAGRNVAGLIAACHEFRPAFAAIADPALHTALRDGVAGLAMATGSGDPAIAEAAMRPVDCTVVAITGFAALQPIMAALGQSRVLALANKESLVCAGPMITARATSLGTSLVPVDSEHSALFQLLACHGRDSVERLYLTASGGPFRTWSLADMARATPAQAVAHPNWDMGAKISVDSATMMNKGLELIEADRLFGFPVAMVDVVVHPESIIHGMVAYADGGIFAHLAPPDMRTLIAHALAWPRTLATPVARLDFAQLGQLTFEIPDSSRFPALGLARDALRVGGAAPTVLNAANEAAVEAFLAGRVGFLDITRVVEELLSRAPNGRLAEINDVLAIDQDTRRQAAALMAAGRLVSAPTSRSQG
ncbi:MAG: 1-deoxy-D-xylulose-5-phosphate reductoisomerase [Alphaproteobacteria bacterium]